MYLDIIAGVFCWCLNRHDVRWVFTKGSWGELEKKKVDFQFCRKKVWECWEAAPLNPSWGNRYLVTCRLLLARYHESGLDDNAIHINMSDGVLHTSKTLATMDAGAVGINSQHWMKTGKETTAWELFCREQHIDPKQIGLIFVGHVNVKFGAWLNERFIHDHQHRLTYQDTLVEWEIYHRMTAVRPGPWALPMDRVISVKGAKR